MAVLVASIASANERDQGAPIGEVESISLQDLVDYWDSPLPRPEVPVRARYLEIIDSLVSGVEIRSAPDEWMESTIAGLRLEDEYSEYTDAQLRVLAEGGWQYLQSWAISAQQEHYVSAVDQEGPFGFTQLTEIFLRFQTDDREQSLTELMALSEAGYLPAQIAVYMIFLRLTPVDVPENRDAAHHHIQLAADAGFIWAIEQYAMQLRHFTDDQELALEYYNRAAELGSVQAHRYVAEMYFMGQGTPQDFEAGMEWLYRAAERGESWMLRILCSNNWPYGSIVYDYEPRIEMDQLFSAHEANEWCLRSIQLRQSRFTSTDASTIGVRFLFDESVGPDIVLAYAWFLISREIEPSSVNRQAGYTAERMRHPELEELPEDLGPLAMQIRDELSEVELALANLIFMRCRDSGYQDCDLVSSTQDE
ncbi:tetratricopeptide repeat protein [Hyphobacterium sp.]|uniref:tetratricopeptide repeat protein n=1 Tax=Hyphobacterium sp. TaxID=2004662 RepID=UPI0037489C79